MAFIYNMTDTWNAGATTFTAIKMNVTDTASAAASLLMDLQVGGTSQFSVRKDVLLKTEGDIYVNTNAGSIRFGASQDVRLYRDGAAILAQRNGTTAQALRVYNTYTDSSNYERGALIWSGNNLFLSAEAAGTGTVRALNLSGSAVNLRSGSAAGGTTRWQIDSSGHFLAATDNTYDIGASGATRPRNVYVAAAVVASNFQSPAGGRIAFSSNGVFALYNIAQTDFDRLQFGGTTSSYPALKRNSAQLDVKLADDSTFAGLAAEYLSVTDGMTAPSAVSGRARIYVDTADGDLKVIFGDGTVKTLATDT